MDFTKKELDTIRWCLKVREDELRDDLLSDVTLLPEEEKELKKEYSKIVKLRVKILLEE